GEAQLRQIDGKTFSKRSFGVVITHTIRMRSDSRGKAARQIDGKTFSKRSFCAMTALFTRFNLESQKQRTAF
ncbi:MAG: hypothetical protein RR058_08100, partial [Oscillospiraceae bacterium]